MCVVWLFCVVACVHVYTLDSYKLLPFLLNLQNNGNTFRPLGFFRCKIKLNTKTNKNWWWANTVLFCACAHCIDDLFRIVGRSCHPLSVLSWGVASAISIASLSLRSTWSWALLTILAVKGTVGTGAWEERLPHSYNWKVQEESYRQEQNTAPPTEKCPKRWITKTPIHLRWDLTQGQEDC